MYWFYNDYYIVYFIIFFNKYNFKNVNNGLMPYLRKQLQKLQTMTEYIFCHALNSSN